MGTGPQRHGIVEELALSLAVEAGDVVSIQTEFAHVRGADGLQFQLDAVAYRGRPSAG